tara:strand:- start:554 stop:664 length:111 start_codon:yes stop_codon:yes gene_type:complete
LALLAHLHSNRHNKPLKVWDSLVPVLKCKVSSLVRE